MVNGGSMKSGVYFEHKSGERTLTQGELINRENLAKSIIPNYDSSRGETFSNDSGYRLSASFSLTRITAQLRIDEFFVDSEKAVLVGTGKEF